MKRPSESKGSPRSTRRSPAAASATASSPGAKRSRARSAARTATRPTGAARCRASATPARLVIVGLAPGAHGANRTGRIFTGDRSGDFLYAGLHRAGFANQPTSRARGDGLKLTDCFITCPVRCVPPDNKPTPDEIVTCRPFLQAELSLLRPRVFLALGHVGWNATVDFLGFAKKPEFAHGACVRHDSGIHLFGCYHVSQQNTQTGRLTPAMFDRVLRSLRAKF